MNHSLLIKLSKQRATFFFQKGSSPFEQFHVEGRESVPLCFMVDGSEVKMGYHVQGLGLQGYPVYDNFFSYFNQTEGTITLLDKSYPITHLLAWAVKSILIREMKISEKKVLATPIRVHFEPNIIENLAHQVLNSFYSHGFTNIGIYQYQDLLLKYYANRILNSNEKVFKQCIYTYSIQDELHVYAYDNLSEKLLKGSQVIKGVVDPRVTAISNLMIDYIAKSNDLTNLNTLDEISLAFDFCNKLLFDFERTPILEGDYRLSNGKSYWYKIYKADLSERLKYEDDGLVISKLKDIIDFKSQPVIIVDYENLPNTYLYKKLSSSQTDVFEVVSKDKLEVQQLFLLDLIRSGYEVGMIDMQHPEQAPAIQHLEILINELMDKKTALENQIKVLELEIASLELSLKNLEKNKAHFVESQKQLEKEMKALENLESKTKGQIEAKKRDNVINSGQGPKSGDVKENKKIRNDDFFLEPVKKNPPPPPKPQKTEEDDFFK